MSDTDKSPRLEVRRIGKRFPGVRALHNVDLTLMPGEVLALVGENGAGKSTLMKILAGIQEPDTGEILYSGKPVRIGSVNDAMELGIALIHQELNLADNLEVGANIFLGREPRNAFGLIDQSRLNRDAAEVLKKVGLETAPTTLVGDLTIGQQQMVEIAKAVSINAQVLIMDEPTSSLSTHETERLFEVINELRDRGVSIIYISHRLGEVDELANRVGVLRDGENAGELTRKEISHDAMVKLMVGRDISQFYARQSNPFGEVRLDVSGLVSPTWPVHQLSFQVRGGEIVGVAGLVGAGRTEMLQTLFGVDSALAGSIRIDGKAVSLNSPVDAIAAGIALVPEDRKEQGLVLEMAVRHNISLAGLRRNRLKAGFLNFGTELSDATTMIDRMRIKTPHDLQVVQYLSGGNQQKVVLGKWLSLGPKVLLLDEPTRGIDIGAKQEIYNLMESLASEGVAIMFVSSEMEEILGMSDRAIVMHEGRISGELTRDELSEQSVMELATGGTSAGPETEDPVTDPQQSA